MIDSYFFDDMVKYFHFLLAHFVLSCTLTVWINLLMTIWPCHTSRLDGVRPHRDTRIIVSMLSDEEEKEDVPVEETIQSGGSRLGIFKMSNVISRMKKERGH